PRRSAALSFTPTAPTQPPTLSLHDALPIYRPFAFLQHGDEAREQRLLGKPRSGDVLAGRVVHRHDLTPRRRELHDLARCRHPPEDRKSTRLNSSHRTISYAVFCLKKKKPTR